ncbi:Phosphatidylinositolglycan class N-domain-containing protein [Pisolithus microcarpus]|nr:Phosphatidylinositolglycan class N-domain-containing protein [Pisolithus microcarpus]
MLLLGALHLYHGSRNIVDKSVRISSIVQISSMTTSRFATEGTQLGLVAAMILVTSSSVNSLQAKAGLPRLNQVAAWLILASSSVSPFVPKVCHPSPTSKIVSFFLAFAVCFVVLSISVEGPFYSSLCLRLQPTSLDRIRGPCTDTRYFQREWVRG